MFDVGRNRKRQPFDIVLYQVFYRVARGGEGEEGCFSSSCRPCFHDRVALNYMHDDIDFVAVAALISTGWRWKTPDAIPVITGYRVRRINQVLLAKVFFLQTGSRLE